MLRGPIAHIPTLGDAEFYLASDTGQLFIGFGGVNFQVGRMATQIQDVVVPSQLLAVDATGKIGVNNFPAVQPVSGSVALTGVAATTQQGGTSGLTGDTQTKGVQGTVALMVQDFKDAGRSSRIYTASFSATTTAGLVTLTPVVDGVSGTPGTSFGVTAGKRFRIQALMLTCFNATAAIHACQVNLLISQTGAVTTASPNVATVAVTTPAATVNEASSQAQSFPDGFELSGTMQFGIEQQGIALAGQTVVVMGYEY